jgi:5'-methylthioadenosine phosphorylase
MLLCAFCASGWLSLAADLPKARIAIVGGTFINDALLFTDGILKTNFTIETPAGTSPKIHYGESDGVPFFYVHMHGEGKWTATWAALAQLGVRDVIGGATAGGVNLAFKTFDCVIPHDFMDFNSDRPKYVPVEAMKDRPSGIPRYNPPMDDLLRNILIAETRKAVRASHDYDDINVHEMGVCTQTGGMRFETPSEVRWVKQIGGDLVTLNVGTEITYARQLGINYACLIVISNPAEGIGPWSWDDIKKVYPRMNPLCVKILLNALPKIAAIPPDAKRVGDELRLHPEMTSKEQK